MTCEDWLVELTRMKTQLENIKRELGMIETSLDVFIRAVKTVGEKK